MTYDEQAKRDYCQRNGANFSTVARMPYEQWTDLRFQEAIALGEPWALDVAKKAKAMASERKAALAAFDLEFGL